MSGMSALICGGALWLYQGDTSPEKPHAELASGKHSGGFFNATMAIQDPSILSKLPSMLLQN
jgi:hypothetical protein